MKRIASFLIASTLACTALAQQPTSASLPSPPLVQQSSPIPTASPQQVDNSALTELFKTDQAARQGKSVDWAKVRPADEERRKQVRQMLDSGEVRTAADYFHAALVFQHGAVPEDFLLAHILAVNSIILGNRDARWLAAATLDRYLTQTGKLQVFGTQFGPAKDAPFDKLPMDKQLLSDSTRTLNCVIPLADQEKDVEDLKNGKPLVGTSIKHCP